ncbi:TIGR04104 family putative zinc finger protein [Priestia koreensis]|uniref:TIGR04104 family putative zinc finger protein n=1 Tax=Priestia koreensis TaxID=284581 RepID=UPI003459F88D
MTKCCSCQNKLSGKKILKSMFKNKEGDIKCNECQRQFSLTESSLWFIPFMVTAVPIIIGRLSEMYFGFDIISTAVVAFMIMFVLSLFTAKYEEVAN